MGLAPGARLYLFDLAGYGSKPLECLEAEVYLFAGWKERMIDILDAIETGTERHELVREDM